MQTILELREAHLELYGGSFFFAREISGRHNSKALFSTIAYQIAMNLPGMRVPINSAMNANMGI